MRKKAETVLLTVLMTASMGITSFAGNWQSDSTGWWWQNDDGSYPAGTWEWIDGNGDGVAESYYFNEQGYCLLDTTTPDGYTVNADGAWIVEGAVQTKNMEASSETPVQPAQYSDDYSGTYIVPWNEKEDIETFGAELTITYDPAANAITVHYPVTVDYLPGGSETYTYRGISDYEDYKGCTVFGGGMYDSRFYFSAPGVLKWLTFNMSEDGITGYPVIVSVPRS